MITITNKTRSPLTIVLTRATQNKTVQRVTQDRATGQRQAAITRITIGDSLRLRVGETSEPLSASYKHEPEIKKLTANGSITLTEIKD